MAREKGRYPLKFQRSHRKSFFIATEGDVTELGYFRHPESLLKNSENKHEFTLKLLPSGNKSSPGQVLNRMMRFLEKNNIHSSDEVWLVVDRNSWLESQLNNLINWANSDERFNLALSNPCFEYWLVLHFEESKKNQNCKYYRDRLKKIDKFYIKGIKKNFYNLKNMQNAVDIAQKNRNARDWNCMEERGCTTVFKLVKKLLDDYGHKNR